MIWEMKIQKDNNDLVDIGHLDNLVVWLSWHLPHKKTRHHKLLLEWFVLVHHKKSLENMGCSFLHLLNLLHWKMFLVDKLKV